VASHRHGCLRCAKPMTTLADRRFVAKTSSLAGINSRDCRSGVHSYVFSALQARGFSFKPCVFKSASFKARDSHAHLSHAMCIPRQLFHRVFFAYLLLLKRQGRLLVERSTASMERTKSSPSGDSLVAIPGSFDRVCVLPKRGCLRLPSLSLLARTLNENHQRW